MVVKLFLERLIIAINLQFVIFLNPLINRFEQLILAQLYYHIGFEDALSVLDIGRGLTACYTETCCLIHFRHRQAFHTTQRLALHILTDGFLVVHQQCLNLGRNLRTQFFNSSGTCNLCRELLLKIFTYTTSTNEICGTFIIHTWLIEFLFFQSSSLFRFLLLSLCFCFCRTTISFCFSCFLLSYFTRIGNTIHLHFVAQFSLFGFLLLLHLPLCFCSSFFLFAGLSLCRHNHYH